MRLPPVILCSGHEHSVSQSEEKHFFCLFNSKAIVKTRMAPEDVNFTSSSDSEDSEVNLMPTTLKVDTILVKRV